MAAWQLRRLARSGWAWAALATWAVILGLHFAILAAAEPGALIPDTAPAASSGLASVLDSRLADGGLAVLAPLVAPLLDPAAAVPSFAVDWAWCGLVLLVASIVGRLAANRSVLETSPVGSGSTSAAVALGTAGTALAVTALVVLVAFLAATGAAFGVLVARGAGAPASLAITPIVAEPAVDHGAEAEPRDQAGALAGAAAGPVTDHPTAPAAAAPVAAAPVAAAPVAAAPVAEAPGAAAPAAASNTGRPVTGAPTRQPASAGVTTVAAGGAGVIGLRDLGAALSSLASLLGAAVLISAVLGSLAASAYSVRLPALATAIVFVTLAAIVPVGGFAYSASPGAAPGAGSAAGSGAGSGAASDAAASSAPRSSARSELPATGRAHRAVERSGSFAHATTRELMQAAVAHRSTWNVLPRRAPAVRVASGLASGLDRGFDSGFDSWVAGWLAAVGWTCAAAGLAIVVRR